MYRALQQTADSVHETKKTIVAMFEASINSDILGKSFDHAAGNRNALQPFIGALMGLAGIISMCGCCSVACCIFSELAVATQGRIHITEGFTVVLHAVGAAPLVM